MYRFWVWLSEFVDRRLVKTAPIRTEDDWVAAVNAAAERWERATHEVTLADWQRAAIDPRKWH